MVIILTPTYNEKDNLPIWAEKVAALGLSDYKMVVVDDNSPDGTGRIAHELAHKYPMRVIKRPKKEG
ncbi:MAG: glycosyltransferase, partial [bacterium]|nr:glycosyltransferase [bacterium]